MVHRRSPTSLLRRRQRFFGFAVERANLLILQPLMKCASHTGFEHVPPPSSTGMPWGADSSALDAQDTSTQVFRLNSLAPEFVPFEGTAHILHSTPDITDDTDITDGILETVIVVAHSVVAFQALIADCMQSVSTIRSHDDCAGGTILPAPMLFHCGRAECHQRALPVAKSTSSAFQSRGNCNSSRQPHSASLASKTKSWSKLRYRRSKTPFLVHPPHSCW